MLTQREIRTILKINYIGSDHNLYFIKILIFFIFITYFVNFQMLPFKEKLSEISLYADKDSHKKKIYLFTILIWFNFLFNLSQCINSRFDYTFFFSNI